MEEFDAEEVWTVGGWREIKVRKLRRIGVWPEGLLDVCIAMIPKMDGDGTPLGQRPPCVFPVVHRVWASARRMQLQEWFKSWVLAWYTTASLMYVILEVILIPYFGVGRLLLLLGSGWWLWVC